MDSGVVSLFTMLHGCFDEPTTVRHHSVQPAVNAVHLSQFAMQLLHWWCCPSWATLLHNNLSIGPSQPT